VRFINEQQLKYKKNILHFKEKKKKNDVMMLATLALCSIFKMSTGCFDARL